MRFWYFKYIGRAWPGQQDFTKQYRPAIWIGAA
jgi:hypothetical protein